MDRRSVIKNAGIAGVLAAGLAPAVHAQAAIRWRMASSFPKSLDTIYGGGEVFAKAVKAMSGGKFEISVHAAGELVPTPGLVDAVWGAAVAGFGAHEHCPGVDGPLTLWWARRLMAHRRGKREIVVGVGDGDRR